MRVETVIDGTDWDHWALWWFDAWEWRARCRRLCMCRELSFFCMWEVVIFCITWPICIGNCWPALVYTWIWCLWHINVSDLGNYYQAFYTITQFLLTKNRMSEAEQSWVFIRGFQPDLWRRISHRLEIKLPNHDPNNCYPLCEINEAAKHVLHGTSQIAFYSLVSHWPHPQLRHHHITKQKIYRCHLSRWHRVFQKCSCCRSQWQTMPAPAPTPKRQLCWIHWAVHSVVNPTILLPNVSYVQTILLTRSVKGIQRKRLYFPMDSLPLQYSRSVYQRLYQWMAQA
jgi:hypothetical protein